MANDEEFAFSRTCRSAPCARRSCSIQGQELSCACGARVTFLLRGQEKSNPKRRPPRLALAGHPARQVREAWRAFRAGSGNRSCVASTPASMPSPARAKRRVHPWTRPLRGLVVPASPPSRGPGRAGAHRARQKRQQQQGTAGLRFAVSLPCVQGRVGVGCSCFCAPGARCSTRGPYGAAGGWRKVRRMAGRKPASFPPVHGCAVEKTRSPPAHPQGRRPGGRAIGVPLSLVTFSRASERK